MEIDLIDKVVISARLRDSDIYVPLFVLDPDVIERSGCDPRYCMFSFTGQMSKFSDTPADDGTATPQVDNPVQPTKYSTSGSPLRTSRSEVENVTILFAV